jgi:hypothetical protein
MNLNTDIVKETIKETGMVLKCDTCKTEIKNEETEFVPIKLSEGKVIHKYYNECLQSNPELLAMWHKLNEERQKEARQERLKREKEMEEQRQNEERSWWGPVRQ